MNVFEKLSAVQNELKVSKSRHNNFGNYDYRNCEDILEAAKPVCARHNTVLFVKDEIERIGDRYYVRAIATFIDCESTEQIVGQAFAREDETKKGMDGSQITGTASSYARKYALNGLLDIDDTKDADTDEFAKQQQKTSRTKKEDDKPIICECCNFEIPPVAMYGNKQWTARQMANYTMDNYGMILCQNCASKKKAEKNDTV